jgi:hypothetical protein
MPTLHRLTPEQSDQANELLALVRKRLDELSGGDAKLKHHMRRRIMKRLEFDERDTPAARRKLKDQKWKEQRGICAICKKDLPETETELDRLDPYGGYTRENTQLLHHACHRTQQAERGLPSEAASLV